MASSSFDILVVRKYDVDNTESPHYLSVNSREEFLAVVGDMAQMQVDMAFETEKVHLNLETVQNGVRNMAENSDMGFYVVATTKSESGSRVIAGMCGVTFEWSDWRNGVFWWIQSVFVKKPYRRQGIFKLLYSSLMERAKRINEELEKSKSDEAIVGRNAAEKFKCCGVRLYHEKDNVNAKASYLKMGMSSTDYEMMEVDFVIQRAEHH
jgi:GNAT superfamily N-acetyltransferase